MRIALAALLSPLVVHAHPGHDAGSGGVVHWLTQHGPELAAVALVLAASIAGWRVLEARRRR